MIYGVNANEAKYGNSMIIDYIGRPIAVAARGRQMTIGAVLDVDQLRWYRNTKLHNTLQQSRNEYYTYLQKPMWPKNKPLLKKKDYAEWAPKPNFY